MYLHKVTIGSITIIGQWRITALINSESMLWAAFGLSVLILLALDLGVFHRKSHHIGINEALLWSAIWLGMAVVFNIIIFFWQGTDAAVAFLASYLVERSLSIDNLFVFLMIFSYFKVPSMHQYRILFWGIVAALVLRGIFVISGIALIERYQWIMYIFGAFLIITGMKMAWHKEEDEMDIGKNPVLKLCRRLLPTTDSYEGGKFFILEGGRLMATPLFIVLLAVETSDLVFAIDSVPAVLGVTLDPFIAYTSNIFAILGLRALYFALAGCMLIFHHLNHGVTLILIFIGIKMVFDSIYEIPVSIALGVIAFILLASIVISIAMPSKNSCKELSYTDQK